MDIDIVNEDQGCGVLVFLWDSSSDSDSRVRKYRTPDSDYGTKKPRTYCVT